MGKPGRPRKLTAEKVVEALKQSHGLKSGACEMLAVTYETLQKYINRSKAAQNVVDHWKRRRVDRAEFKLDEAIERGENWAIMFTLKPARDRNYNDRLEVTGDNGGPMVVKLVVEYADERIPDNAT